MKLEKYSQAPETVSSMSNKNLREAFTAQGLFAAGEVNLCYWEQDRTVIGAAVPQGAPLELPVPPLIGEDSFCARRELGVINIGEAGAIEVDGTVHSMAPFDGLYIAKGAEKVIFRSDDSAKPARFYLLSYPAHASFETKKIPRKSIEPLNLGTSEGANERKLYKVIQPETVKSCQLVMGYTQLLPGSVWNTMPPHTHTRRSEVYLYFGMPEDRLVVHLMGRPDDTRHLIMRNEEVVLSPSWSIHAGAGTANYSFIWGMGGENQDFTDMQGFDLKTLL